VTDGAATGEHFIGDHGQGKLIGTAIERQPARCSGAM
jgi:hypothetical protein